MSACFAYSDITVNSLLVLYFGSISSMKAFFFSSSLFSSCTFSLRKEHCTLYQVAHNMKCRIKRHGQIKLKHTHMCSSYFFFKIEDWKKKKKTNKTGECVRNRGIKIQSFLYVELFLEKIMIQDVERWRDEETFSIVKVLMILRMYN